jgi:hypothetical protein
MDQRKHVATRRNTPVVNRDVMIISDRVVSIHTQHLGESHWSATGYISESLPTGKWLGSPERLTASGRTEAQAIDALKQLVLCKGGVQSE